MNHRNSRHTVHTKPRFTFSSQSRPQLHGAETEASCNYTGEVAPGNLVNRAYIFSFLFFFFFFSFFRLGETPFTRLASPRPSFLFPEKTKTNIFLFVCDKRFSAFYFPTMNWISSVRVPLYVLQILKLEQHCLIKRIKRIKRILGNLNGKKWNENSWNRNGLIIVLLIYQ